MPSGETPRPHTAHISDVTLGSLAQRATRRTASVVTVVIACGESYPRTAQPARKTGERQNAPRSSNEKAAAKTIVDASVAESRIPAVHEADHDLTVWSRAVTLPSGVKAAGHQKATAAEPLAVGGTAVALRRQPDTRVVSITVPGEFAFRALISRAVATVCKLACPSHPQSEQFCNEVVSAVGEAFNNAVIHAYESMTGELTLTVAYDSHQVMVELADHGRAFDLDSVPEYLGEDPQESGMGLFIIRSFVDELRYIPGVPNRLRMTKVLPQP